MNEVFLHDLGRLPIASKVCIVGKRGRNSRFTRVLDSLRPDLEVVSSITTGDAASFQILHQTTPYHVVESLHAADLLLTTLGKYRKLLEILRELEAPPCLVVNPNFYHPFLQFDAGKEAGVMEKLSKARSLYRRKEDAAIYDLVMSSLHPRINYLELYHKLLEFHGRMGHQYLDFVNARAVRTVIEGGIGDGLTTVRFLRYFSRPTVYGFDPDVGGFRESYFREHLKDNPRVQIFPLALWSRTERLPFLRRQPGSSGVVETCDPECSGYIDATSIDEFVRSFEVEKVDFIKLDTEGSDFEAVKGAEETIRQHRPQIAVCLYHSLDHYYEIPLFLARHAPDYVFRLGHYSPLHLFSETVLYAIPAELYSDPGQLSLR